MSLYNSGKILAGKYNIGSEIGSGRHGVVYNCCCQKSGTRLAVKTISKLSPASMASADREKSVYAQLLRESKNLSRNVIHAKEILEDENNMYIVQELALGGDLWHLMRQIGKCNELQARVLMRGILEAIKTCHEQGIVHSDLKLENFVLGADGALQTVRLIDFGTAEILTDGNQCASFSLGSFEYMAPEREAGECTAPSREQRLAGDVYSAGVIMYILLLGHYPNKKNLANGKGWAELSAETHALLEAMTHPDPYRRPSATEALRSAWLLGRV
jgi:calcium-dependent protein kinase